MTMKPTLVRRLCAATIALAFALSACSGDAATPTPPPATAPASSERAATAENAPQPAADAAITLETPRDGEVINGTFEVKGSVAATPQEGSLIYRLYDIDGNLITSGPVAVSGDPGQPGTFADIVAFELDGLAGPGLFEMVDQEPTAGVVVADMAINVHFGQAGAVAARPAQSQSIAIQSPSSGALVGGPFELRGALARAPQDSALVYRVYDADGYLIGVGQAAVENKSGGAAAFTAPITYTLDVTTAGRIAVVDQDAASGAILGRGVVEVVLAPTGPALDEQALTDGVIVIQSPADRSVVNAPIQLKGGIASTPAESQLTYRLYDAQGHVISTGPIAVIGEPGEPGTFAATIEYGGWNGAGQLEILDQDQTDGLVYSSAAVNLFYGASPGVAAPPVAAVIAIESPLMGDVITSPVAVSGTVSVVPFENNLVYRVYDSAGNLVGSGAVPVTGEQGQAGEFAATVEYAAGVGNAGRIQVLDLSAADGSVLARAIAEIFLKDVVIEP